MLNVDSLMSCDDTFWWGCVWDKNPNESKTFISNVLEEEKEADEERNEKNKNKYRKCKRHEEKKLTRGWEKLKIIWQF